MKLFLDTADLEDIKRAKDSNLISGITTNPTSLSKAISKTGSNIIELIKNISNTMENNPVSVEVTEKEPSAIYDQAKRISDLAPNIVVKIPAYKDYIPVINKLVTENIAINITLLFSLPQALVMCNLGVKYISPFVGRLDEIDTDGIELIYDIKDMVDTYNYKTEILAASIRHVRHVHEVILAGADIATMPNNLLDKMLDHPLTIKGMEIFDKDWQKLGIKTFP